MKQKLLKLKDNFDVFLFDMYGVLWDGKAPIAQMQEAAEELVKAGKKVIILSNSADLSKDKIDSYAKMGMVQGKTYNSAVTAGDLARDVFLSDDRALKYYPFCHVNKELFEGTKHTETKSVKEADFVLAGFPIEIDEKGDWHPMLNIDKFKADLKKFKDMGKTLICCNPDLKAFTPFNDEPIVIDGALAQYHQELGGEAEYFGKPYPEIYDFALQDYDGDDDRVLMIGDTLETDILGANSYGIKSALVSGGIASYNMKLEGFETLEEYAEEVGIVPDYFL